jgi:hypothetical protein
VVNGIYAHFARVQGRRKEFEDKARSSGLPATEAAK